LVGFCPGSTLPNLIEFDRVNLSLISAELAPIKLGQVSFDQNLVVLDSDQILIELAPTKFGRVGPSQKFGQTRASRLQPKFGRFRLSQSEPNLGLVDTNRNMYEFDRVSHSQLLVESTQPFLS